MGEAVRLVVWDLDETFWQGTLTEGGIRAYIRAHHDIVIELARRGIMSAICSKNDPEPVMAILRRAGIADYFIFPSIAWTPKGPRLARLIEQTHLRPATVMFVDDSPANRGEAQALLPELQVAGPEFIAAMLADPRFAGRDDRGLTRLNQYKLLEARDRDAREAAGDNRDFLRASDIRVEIVHDVEPHLDRAIELINRTNQLNFTKLRLPEDRDAARAALRRQIDDFSHVPGLVRVADRYGDYGFVGFFLRAGFARAGEGGIAAASYLIHFCFSCRTLGMEVERFVHAALGRPAIAVAGPVLADLNDPAPIDWIRLVDTIGETAAGAGVAPQITLVGGCEAEVLGTYLQRHAPRVAVRGTYMAGGLMVLRNTADGAIDGADRDPALFAAESAILGLPIAAETGDAFAAAPAGTLFVVNFSLDATGAPPLRHRRHGWRFHLLYEGLDLPVPAPPDALDQALAASTFPFTAEARARLPALNRHIAADYERLPALDEAGRVAGLRETVRRIPAGARLIVLLPHDVERHDGALVAQPWAASYAALARAAIAEAPFAAAIAVGDLLRGDDEILLLNHYHREVYVRLADRIAAVASTLPGRTD